MHGHTPTPVGRVQHPDVSSSCLCCHRTACITGVRRVHSAPLLPPHRLQPFSSRIMPFSFGAPPAPRAYLGSMPGAIGPCATSTKPLPTGTLAGGVSSSGAALSTPSSRMTVPCTASGKATSPGSEQSSALSTHPFILGRQEGSAAKPLVGCEASTAAQTSQTS